MSSSGFTYSSPSELFVSAAPGSNSITIGLPNRSSNTTESPGTQYGAIPQTPTSGVANIPNRAFSNSPALGALLTTSESSGISTLASSGVTDCSSPTGMSFRTSTSDGSTHGPVSPAPTRNSFTSTTYRGVGREVRTPTIPTTPSYLDLHGATPSPQSGSTRSHRGINPAEYENYAESRTPSGLDQDLMDFDYNRRPRSQEHTQELKNWVDGLQPIYGLTPGQIRELKGLVMVASLVETGHLKLHLLQYAACCRSDNKMESIHTNSTSFKEVVDGALTQMKKCFEISPTHRTALRVIARDEIAKPTRTNYSKAHLGVWERCKNEAEVHGFTELFKKTEWETALHTEASNQTGKMLQQLRNDMLATVVDNDGKKGHLSLEQATFNFIQKYVKGGLGSGNGHLHQFRVAIFRRFLRENECEEEGPILKRQKNMSGKQAKEVAFWGRVDKHLESLKDQFQSSDLRSDKWTEYLIETIKEDWRRFGEPSNILPRLPFSVAGTPVIVAAASTPAQNSIREPLGALSNASSNSSSANAASGAGGGEKDTDYLHF